MNKYLLLTAISMLFMGSVFSQQKVKDRTVEGNTLPNGNAILELESTNKGLLHTRVTLTSSTEASPLSQHVAGMMVYNTVTVNDVVPGIYYNDGTKWVLAGAVTNGANNISYNPASYEITYVDDEGNTQTIDLQAVVKANETTTTLVDNEDGTYTYTNETGATVLIDVPGDVADNFENILNNPDVQALLNEFVAGQTYGNVTFDGTAFSYVDGAGNPQVLDFAALVQANETVTTLTENGDGTYTYTNEDGTVVTFDANTSTVTDNGDGTYTVTNRDGTTVTIDAAGEVLTELQDNTSDIYTEVVSLINTEIVANSDALVDNGDGTFTHTAADGTVVNFDANTSTVTDNGDGTYTITNADGTTVTIDAAGEVLTELQDNTSDIYNEIQNIITAGSDALVDNGDGTFTHTAADGTVVNFDANTSTVTDNGDGTYTITNADGTTVTIDTSGDVLTELQDNTSDIYTEIQNIITAGSDELVDNGDGTFTHTAADGTVVNFDANTSTVTDNGDGTYTVTNGDGTTVTIDTPGDVLTELQDNTSDIYNEIQNIITAGSDALVDNGDGTFTHTAADGTVVTFDANTSTVTDNGDGTYTVTNGDGTTVIIDTPGDVLTELQDNTSDIYTEIQNIITAGSDALVDNGDGTFTHTAADGTVVNFDANTSTVTDNGDGTYTVTNADGTTVTIDTPGDVLTELQDNTSDIYTEIQNIITAGSDELVDNGDGTFTHTAADGTVVNFDANTSTVTDNGDGTYTVTNADGTTVTIDTPGDVLTELQDNTSDIYTEIQNIITAGSDALVDNGDGTFTHTAADGTVVNFDANTSTVTDNGDGTYTVTNGDGTTVIIDTPGDVLTELQDNTSDIYTEIVNIIGANETLTTSVFDPSTGIFTYTDEDGTPNTLDLGAMVPNFETTSTVVDNGDGTYTFTNEDGIETTISITANETVTTLVDNGDGTYTYYNEAGVDDAGDPIPGSGIAIDIPADVISNFETIIGDADVLNELIEQLTNTSVGGNVYYDGAAFTYVDAAGNTQSIDFGDLVQANETVTTLVDNGDGTYTYYNEAGIDDAGNPIPGSGVAIDIPADVISNFETIIGDADVLNELIEQLTNTSVGGNVYYDGAAFTYVDAAGNTQSIDFGELVQANETVTTLVDNGDGTYTYYNEAGVDDAGDPIPGSGIAIDIPADVISNFETIIGDADVLNELIEQLTNTSVGGNVYYDGAAFTYVDAAGNTQSIDFGDLVQANETVTTLVDNGDGTYTYYNEAGVDDAGDPIPGSGIAIDIPADVISNFETIIGDADVLNELIEQLTNTSVGGNVYYDGAAFTYVDAAGNTQSIDFGDLVQANETVTTLVDNGDGTYTYYNEAGVDDAGDPIPGSGIAIDIPADVISNFETIIGDADVLNELIEQLTNTSVGGNVYYDGTEFTYVDGDGNPQTINFGELVQANETRTLLVDNTDGTYTYYNESEIDGNGDPIPGTGIAIDIPAGVINHFEEILNDADVLNELIEQLTNTSVGGNVYYDGTEFTYVDGDGNPQTINFGELVQANETRTLLVDNTDGTYTYYNESEIDGNGDPIPGTGIAIDIPAGVINHFEEIIGDETVLNELIEQLTNTSVGGNVYYDGTEFTYVDGDGNPQTINFGELVQANETRTLLVDNTDGTYTYYNESEIDGNGDPIPGTGIAIDIPAGVINHFEEIIGDETVLNELIEQLTNTSVGGNVYYDGTEFTYVDGDGNPQTINFGELVQANETRTLLVDNTDGTYTYYNESEIDGNGDPIPGTGVAIDIPAGVINHFEEILNDADVLNELIEQLTNTSVGGNVYYDGTEFTYVDGDGNPQTINFGELVQANETRTLLVDNTDGTYTYYNESEIDGNGDPIPGTGVAIDIPAGVINQFEEIIGDETVLNELIEQLTNTSVGGNVYYDGTEFTYVDGDGNPQTIDFGELVQANETITTLALTGGSLAYTNEGDSNADVSLISADADNALVAGTDGALFVPEAESINIYNSNGTLTSSREVTLDGNSLTFQGEDGYLDIEVGGSNLTLHGANDDRARLRLSTDDLNGNGTNSTFDMSLFSDNYLQMFAMGEMGGISFGTHNTLNPSPIEFLTSPGGGALGETRIKIEGNGNINFTQYPNTRDDSGDTPVSNILYTDDGGNLLSAPAANLAIEPWQVQATTGKATDNTQDIYQTGSVAIGTDDIPDLIVDGDDLTSTVKLHVDGNITTSGKLYTTNSMYADYVFEKYFNGHSDLNTKYEFASLSDVKNFIKKNHHLPGVASIADLSKSAKGYTFDLTSLSIQQLEKIEELFIHTIEQQELLEQQQAQLEKQQKELDELKDRLAKIERLLNQQ